MVLHSQSGDGKGGHGITLSVLMVRVDMVLHSQSGDGKGGHGITLTEW